MMAPVSERVCTDDRRRRKLTRKSGLYGVDYVELGEQPSELVVCFVGRAPAELPLAAVCVEGGRRVRNVHTIRLRWERASSPDKDDRLIVSLDRVGDGSTYTLRIAALDERGLATAQPPADFDPRYDRVPFSFAVDCPGDLDCKSGTPCPEGETPPLELDYLAKDYASLRQLMLQRMALVAPNWQERHAPDLAITLVELIAYLADQLSYYQDAVATEAYLDTARLRISVRRHLRLVDYLLHEGCNARSWLCMTVSQDVALAGDSFFVVNAISETEPPMLKEAEWRERRAPTQRVFEPITQDGQPLRLRAAHNEIRLYTWDGTECCLTKGSTRATLRDGGVLPEIDPEPPGTCDDQAEAAPSAGAHTRSASLDTSAPALAAAYRLDLKVCDVLIFEEVKGPKTGLPQDADPIHRHAVRLTHVERSLDPVPDAQGQQRLLWEIRWHEEDALPFPVCISTQGPPPHCLELEDVSVLRGNVILVDHGESLERELSQVPLQPASQSCDDPCTATREPAVQPPFRPRLAAGDLSHRAAPVSCRDSDPCAETARPSSALHAFAHDPRGALPQIVLTSIPAISTGIAAFSPADVLDPSDLARNMAQADPTEQPQTPAAWLWQRQTKRVRDALKRWHDTQPPTALPDALRVALVASLREFVQTWTPRSDLLSSGPTERHFVVEMDDARDAQLRFGDGALGALPEPGAYFYARFRVGNGRHGNLGPGRLNQLVFRSEYPSGIELRAHNPLPALAGQDFESIQAAKRRAPHAFRQNIARAITADDYALIAKRDFPTQVQRAAAVMRWNGHLPEVQVAIDPFAHVVHQAELRCRIERRLRAFKRIGHRLRVVPAVQVPLRIALWVCVKPSYAQGEVAGALLDRFSCRLTKAQKLGFFHPDNLSFGQPVRLSEIVALAQSVPGVAHLKLTKLERYWTGANGELGQGLLALAPLEIARLDNDPSAPSHGVMELTLEGGR